MRISDWSSDVCSSDLLLSDRVLDHLLSGRGAGADRAGRQRAGRRAPRHAGSPHRQARLKESRPVTSSSDATNGTSVEPVLRIDGLTVRLPRDADRENAIEGVGFEVRPREILCVVGESGSGKSVTAYRSEEHPSEIQSLM